MCALANGTAATAQTLTWVHNMDLTQNAAPVPLDNRRLAVIDNNPGMWEAGI